MNLIDVIYTAAMGVAYIALLHPTAHIQGDVSMTKPKAKVTPAGPTTEGRIKSILSELLQIDEMEITPLSKIQEDLGADSLDIVEFVMLLEEEFGITVTDDQGEKVITVADAVKLVDRLHIPEAIEA